MAKELKDLTKRSENYSQWYNDLVVKADLAEQSAVRGCMVIKPYGYAIWEKMQRQLDDMFKETGHVNAYFPLLIPKSFLSREAEHVEGFAKECAVVTHYRLKNAEDGSGVVVDPAAKLEEELIIRPTSETIIWNTYKNWIQSYRDLPILCNQWANVFRWEMRTRLFLRTAEFLWQEGHTAHATAEEAEERTIQMLNLYADFCEEVLAIPVIKGQKTDKEKFSGAEATYTIEALMHDCKALQSGTSHNFGNGFAKAFGIEYTNKENKLSPVYETSWGMSTRIIGAIIMVHGDDSGLVLPPRIAPVQTRVIPIAQHKEGVLEKANELTERLKKAGYSVKIDDSEKSPGWKFSEQEMLGIPTRIEIGPKDIEQNQVVVVRRDTREKIVVSLDEIETKLGEILETIQKDMYDRAKAFLDSHIDFAETMDEMNEKFNTKRGFIKAKWCGSAECEDEIKAATGGATTRCICKEDQVKDGDTCIFCGKQAKHVVYFGKAY